MINRSCQRWSGKFFIALTIYCVLPFTVLSSLVSLRDLEGRWRAEVVLPGGTLVQSLKEVNRKGEYVEYLTNCVSGQQRTGIVAGTLCVSNGWLLDIMTNNSSGAIVSQTNGVWKIVAFSREQLLLVSPNGSNRVDYLRDTNAFILPRISAALQKAKRIKLSSVKFDKLPLAVVITMLHNESVKQDAARKGVTISLEPDAKQQGDSEVNLDLRDITLAETLERIADSIGLEIQATDTAILLVPKRH